MSIILCPQVSAQVDDQLNYEEIASYINGTRMMDVVQLIASDEFLGRYPGSQGDQMTQDYIASILEMLKLQPIGDDATYFQGVAGITSNVLGLLKTNQGNQTIIISAHHDHLGNISSDIYNGANDNASGVSVVLEVARILADLAQFSVMKTNLVFAFWGAEEQGQIGSNQFLLEKLPDNLNLSINLVINLDEVGYDAGDHTLWVSGGLDIPERYQTEFREAANQSNIELINLYHSNGGSDHQPFLNQGIPAMTLIWTAHRPYYHTPEDTAEKIDVNLLETTTHLLVEYLVNQLEVIEIMEDTRIPESATSTSSTRAALLELNLFMVGLIIVKHVKKSKNRQNQIMLNK